MEYLIAALTLCLGVLVWLHGYFSGERRAYETIIADVCAGAAHGLPNRRTIDATQD